MSDTVQHKPAPAGLPTAPRTPAARQQNTPTRYGGYPPRRTKRKTR